MRAVNRIWYKWKKNKILLTNLIRRKNKESFICGDFIVIACGVA